MGLSQAKDQGVTKEAEAWFLQTSHRHKWQQKKQIPKPHTNSNATISNHFVFKVQSTKFKPRNKIPKSYPLPNYPKHSPRRGGGKWRRLSQAWFSRNRVKNTFERRLATPQFQPSEQRCD